MKVTAAIIAALVLAGCEVQTPLGAVSVTRGPSFERHIDERPTQQVRP